VEDHQAAAEEGSQASSEERDPRGNGMKQKSKRMPVKTGPQKREGR
jgi:hypothetical protein